MNAPVGVAEHKRAAVPWLDVDFKTGEILPSERRIGQRLPYLLRRRGDVGHINGVRLEFARVDHAHAPQSRATSCAPTFLSASGGLPRARLQFPGGSSGSPEFAASHSRPPR